MAMEDEDVIIIGFGGAFFRLFHLFFFVIDQFHGRRGGNESAGFDKRLNKTKHFLEVLK